MTGELADNFESRKTGVLYIADAVERVCENRRVVYYCCDGQWRSRQQLDRDWDLVAAANWHATAIWGARMLPNGTGLVIDVGSTTTDLSIVADGEVSTASRNDLQRLTTGQLLYVGAGRTPICGLLDDVQYRQQRIALANELFATVGDAAIWKRLVPESAKHTQTADGRPKSRTKCGQRMARMLCRDLVDLEIDLIDAMADQTISAAAVAIGDAISRMIADCGEKISHALVLGEGKFLATQALERFNSEMKVVLLADEVNELTSACGPAHAVAVLASEQLS
jgi:probable H4MPT-linked C1 transfer pathway protein